MYPMVSKQLFVNYETVVMQVLKRLIQICCIFKDIPLIIRTAICITELISNIRLWKSSPCETINVDGNSENIIFKFGSNVNNGIKSQCLSWITCSVVAHSGYTLFGRRQSIPLVYMHLSHDHLGAGQLPFIWPQAIVPTVNIASDHQAGIFDVLCENVLIVERQKNLKKFALQYILIQVMHSNIILISLPHEIYILHIYI